MTIYDGIGEKMRKLRIKSGKTQSEFAEEIFTNAKHYGRSERGQVKISLDLLNKIADVHDVELKEFFEEPCKKSKEEVIAEIRRHLQNCKEDDLLKILQIIKLFI